MDTKLIGLFIIGALPGALFTWLGLRAFENPQEAQDENVNQWSNPLAQKLARVGAPLWAMKLWGFIMGFLVGPALLLLALWCLFGFVFPSISPTR